MLELKRLIDGSVDFVDFDITVDAAGSADDVISGSANAKGRVTDHSGYIVLEGEIIPDMTVRCARCAAEFGYNDPIPLKAKITDKLANDDEDEFVLMTDKQIDLEELVRTTLVLGLPSRFLCREDCKGLCPKCGADLNVSRCGCDLSDRDPRWDALLGFFDE